MTLVFAKSGITWREFLIRDVCVKKLRQKWATE